MILLRVLAICSYPLESASTRFRLAQFVEPLALRGIKLDISPFLTTDQFAGLYSSGNLFGKAFGIFDSILKRIAESFRVRSYDVILVQREAAIIGPAIFEKLFRFVSGKPLVLDLDDATYVRYTSPSYGRVGSYLKFFGKTDALIRAAEVVICGNRFIAEYVNALGTEAVVVPTVVDTDRFVPATDRSNPIPVMGWIGTHSTFPFLQWILPVLEKLGTKHRFQLKIVGAGRDDVSVAGVETISSSWRLDTEIEDFQSIDIGLYPLTLSGSASEEWLRGKSGFKAIQYMAVGVPFVMSPLGVAAELGIDGVTHFNATTLDDWYTCLDRLLSDVTLRVRMGIAARTHSLEHFTVAQQAEIVAEALRRVAGQTDA